MFLRKGKYSGIIAPISYLIDLLVINLFAFFLPINLVEVVLFHSYISLAWIIIALMTKFYVIYRYTKATQILILLFRQFFFYFLILYAFIGFFKQPNMSRLALAKYAIFVFLAISTIKFISYFLLLKYRQKIKGNTRNVVVIGKNKKTEQLINVFNQRTEYGYEFVRQFCPRKSDFDIRACFLYIVEQNVDEIYCSVSELRNDELAEFIDFADNNLKTLKFLPDNKKIFSKKLKFEYYDYLPILSLRDIPLHNPINALLKRTFDIVFSFIVVFGLLIWIAPILALIISLESKGPVFFVQKRTGFDNKEFTCFKFRSMTLNPSSDLQQAGKNDMRVTQIGKFLRRTSIDELPQFYNVLFGNMSVVGPRPHMIKHTDEYASRVDKYMLRHFVKPGITGLAQVRGYRGEIEKDSDIQNRIKFDIFYVENWSFFLDIKIIIQTILLGFSGDEKAY
ncbi:exopolysaccharide biosynthesis polyprenyl glycosylphosphotransferase [uncultured Eudoraea sp.]|uniref:exopolysaccharide biosynthesis polyprenyl glycosylphosphotransferase n=1 Tax=uncultured Eudoraea sp. TaxID=1035614 RepID=UPI002610C802|nr:exopolysaccharide biosynthesis polyprenyl glycosylphosphotransferase [uncultured Eudoraea sp.]